MDFQNSLAPYLPEEEIQDLLKAIKEGKVTHCLLINTDKITDEEFVKRYPNVRKHPFVEHAYYYEKEEYDFGSSLYYLAGVYSIQDASAMMVNYFLKPEEDDVILDMCAAPGGKSIGASIAMNGKGCIISNDISYPRAKEMSQNVERMGRGNIVVSSTDFVFSYVHFGDTFDKIILDAPCSGSAMMRKNEAAEADWKYSKVKANAKRQSELLELAYSMLKPGGTIAYSTCSFSYEEDEAVVLAFKEKHKEIEIVPLPEHPSFYRTDALKEAVRLHPNHFEGEGQFICLLRKPGSSLKTKKTIISNDRYKLFCQDYGIEDRSNELRRDKFYSLYQHFDVSHLNILRYGVKLFEMRDSGIFIPDHHLAAYLNVSYSVKITEEEAKAYIYGNTFPMDKEDGFYIVSYDNVNLGFVKVTQGIAKNHYPKSCIVMAKQRKIFGD